MRSMELGSLVNRTQPSLVQKHPETYEMNALSHTQNLFPIRSISESFSNSYSVPSTIPKRALSEI
jgi:hypothetical protein